jgi:RNA polymerase sigma factor (sigma-70 family)
MDGTLSAVPMPQRAPASARPPQADDPVEPTDAELVAAIRSGDARTAEIFYRRLRGPIDRALLRVFGRREQDHEDFVQIALEQVVDSLAMKSFRGHCSLTTWGALIGSRVALGEIRRRVRRGPHEAPAVELAAGVDESERLQARQLLRQVRAALAQLGRRRADVVYLSDIEGYSEGEIAEALGISVAAAHSRLVRGRRGMRAALRDILEARDD